MNLRDQMDKIYRELLPNDIPWNLTEPPRLLIEAVKSGQIKLGRAIDLGCGAGNYAIWLAGQGFEVIGLDISAEAIAQARQNAQAKNSNCHFAVADLLGDLSEYHNRGLRR